MANKKCKQCGEVKPLSAFYSSRGYPFNPCKKCFCANRRAIDPEKKRDANKKSYYKHADKRRNDNKKLYKKYKKSSEWKLKRELYRRQRIRELVDGYIIKMLAENYGIKKEHITQEMISLQRNRIKIHRACQ
jgi:C-terminal processing protease CtpA/Prc